MNDTALIRLRFPQNEARLKEIAESTSAGIWRIKRAKIILELWKGRTVDQLVLDVRVPPESVVKCIKYFAQKGLAYFDEPDRKPTSRETRVGRLQSFLDNPLNTKSDRWRRFTVHYIGRDFTAKEISQLRAFIASHPKANHSQVEKLPLGDSLPRAISASRSGLTIISPCTGSKSAINSTHPRHQPKLLSGKLLAKCCQFIVKTR
jgi:hypothetical protein